MDPQVVDFSVTCRNHRRWKQLASMQPHACPWWQVPALVGRVQAAEIPFVSPVPSAVKTDMLVSDLDVQSFLANETGRDRLRVMFEKTTTGALSPELYVVVDCTKSAAMISFFFSAIFGGRNAKAEFIRTHQHTKFPTKFRALRAHQDAIFLGALKFGAKWALRTAAFTSIFLFTSQTISVYRNKSSLMEYSIAGFVTGSTLRLNLGLRGWVAGGVLGAAFGTVGGMLMWAAMKMAHETQEERHYWGVHEQLREHKELQQQLS